MLLLLWLAFFIYFHVNDLYFISNISNKKKNINLATAKKQRIFNGKHGLRRRKERKKRLIIRQRIRQHVFGVCLICMDR